MSNRLEGRQVLVTGASGYVGGELVGPLLDAGARVRVLVRSPERLSERSWRNHVEVVKGDASDPGDLRRAVEGIEVTYYLMHSMDGGGHIGEREERMACQFVDAATAAKVGRIIYLGGMHPAGSLSEHLASRTRVGQILLDGPVPAIVLQAAVILGAGSTSFDMLRYLTGRLPVMVTPQWVRNRLQPIAIDDVLHYLVGAATLSDRTNRTFDIGGPEVLTYEQLMQRYAAVTGRRHRIIVSVPVLTPALASHWIGLVTPVAAKIARPLVGSLVHEVVAQEDDLRARLPKADGLVDLDEALSRAETDSPPDGGPRKLALATAAAAGVGAAGRALWTAGRRRSYGHDAS